MDKIRHAYQQSCSQIHFIRMIYTQYAYSKVNFTISCNAQGFVQVGYQLSQACNSIRRRGSSCYCFRAGGGGGALFLLFNTLLYSQRVASHSCETLGELLHRPIVHTNSLRVHLGTSSLAVNLLVMLILYHVFAAQCIIITTSPSLIGLWALYTSPFFFSVAQRPCK